MFIAVEPFYGSTEAGLERDATLIRLATEQGHTLFVHPATRDDLREGKDPTGFDNVWLTYRGTVNAAGA